jgi:hypothetical protein
VSSETGRALAPAEEGVGVDEERKGISPIIEIVEALGIVLYQYDKHFLVVDMWSRIYFVLDEY